MCKKRKGHDGPSATLHSAIARIYLQAGHLSEASRHFAEVQTHPNADGSVKDMTAALLASAEGDCDKVVDILQRLLAQNPSNLVVRGKP